MGIAEALFPASGSISLICTVIFSSDILLLFPLNSNAKKRGLSTESILSFGKRPVPAPC